MYNVKYRNLRAPVFGRHQFFGTSEHYRKAHGSLLSGWMNYNYTACCWFPTSSNILIIPSQFWQIRFESCWLHCSKVPNTGAFTVCTLFIIPHFPCPLIRGTASCLWLMAASTRGSSSMGRSRDMGSGAGLRRRIPTRDSSTTERCNGHGSMTYGRGGTYEGGVAEQQERRYVIPHSEIAAIFFCCDFNIIFLHLGNSTWENVIPLPLTCEDKRPKRKRRTWNVGQISIQNKGDMMKIEMKHYPGVTVL